MAKQKIEKASRKERRGGQQHRGWNYDNKKGKSWNARRVDDHGNQVGKYNPQERLFGPGESDRPADVKANVAAAAQDGRGSVPQGTTAATQRPALDNWYHNTQYGQQGVTKDTSVADWQHTTKRQR